MGTTTNSRGGGRDHCEYFHDGYEQYNLGELDNDSLDDHDGGLVDRRRDRSQQPEHDRFVYDGRYFDRLIQRVGIVGERRSSVIPHDQTTGRPQSALGLGPAGSLRPYRFGRAGIPWITGPRRRILKIGPDRASPTFGRARQFSQSPLP